MPDDLVRAAILLALAESPVGRLEVDELEVRVAELLEMGESEIRRRGLALVASRRN